MKRQIPYIALSRELERWAQFPVSELRALVGAAPICSSVEIDTDLIEVEIHFEWQDAKKGQLRIVGDACRINAQLLEKIQAHLLVEMPSSQL